MNVLAAAILAASTGSAPASTVVDLSGASIRLGDVARRTRGSTAAIEIARLPIGRSSFTLSRAALTALARRSAPGFDAGKLPDRITFRRTRPAPAVATCLVASGTIGAGDAIGPDRVGPGPCVGPTSSVRYDAAAGTLVATVPIAAGWPVGGALPRSAPAVSRGDALTLVSRSGPVTVERSVAALQPGRSGGRVFVRSVEGQVFAVAVQEPTR